MRFSFALCLGLALCLSSSLSPGEVVRREVGNLVLEGIPEVPPELLDRLNQYQNMRGAGFRPWYDRS